MSTIVYCSSGNNDDSLPTLKTLCHIAILKNMPSQEEQISYLCEEIIATESAFSPEHVWKNLLEHWNIPSERKHDMMRKSGQILVDDMEHKRQQEIADLTTTITEKWQTKKREVFELCRSVIVEKIQPELTMEIVECRGTDEMKQAVMGRKRVVKPLPLDTPLLGGHEAPENKFPDALAVCER